MKSVVCVKLVPDSAARLSVENGRPNWGDAPLVINPWDEYAVEAALVQKEAHDGDVVALSLGGDGAREALKHALAMGCSEAVLISDLALAQADGQAVARVLAAAIQKIGGVDLAFFGRTAIDTDSASAAPQAARALGWPALTLASAIEVDAAGRKVRVTRSIEEGRQTVEGPLPAVISVVKDIGEPRYPSFMGIRKASKAAIPVWTLADLALASVPSVVRWGDLSVPPQREVVTEMITGNSPEEVAEKLVDKILAERAL